MTSYHLYEKHLKDKPYHYEYSDISNLNLLKEYEFSRREYIIKLKKVNISKNLKLNKNFKFFLSKKINYWPYPHKKTEEILKLIVTKKKYKKVPLWVNEIIRKFEVSKRIRKFYNKDFTRKKHFGNASIDAYINLYYLVAHSNCYKNELKKFNLLLKIGDLIFGSFNLVKTENQKIIIYKSLSKELKLFEKFLKLKKNKYE